MIENAPVNLEGCSLSTPTRYLPDKPLQLSFSAPDFLGRPLNDVSRVRLQVSPLADPSNELTVALSDQKDGTFSAGFTPTDQDALRVHLFVDGVEVPSGPRMLFCTCE
jgi:hypothetical protein